MAYGQTGTGKTYTIVKDILPQTTNFLTKYIEKTNSHLFFSAVQIYNEKLTDLIDVSRKLKLREKNNSFYIENMFDKRVQNLKELSHLIDITERNRKKGVTSLNDNSSRSHAVYIFRLVQKEKHLVSLLNLVDLAGSERIDKSKIKVDKYNESISINTSLTALSKCIVHMSGKKNTHIPFRESKLTKILMNSLSGNSKTCLIVTLSASKSDIDETIASLSFGQRACKVKVKPVINSKAEKVDKKFIDELNKELKEKDKLIDDLKEENGELSENIESRLIRSPYY